MFAALNQRLLALAKAKVKPVRCPSCGDFFQPFSDREITCWQDFGGGAPCPRCGYIFTLKDKKTRPSDRLEHELRASKSGPQPQGSLIEKKPVAEGQVLYYIPATGDGQGFLGFALIWNSFLAIVLMALVTAVIAGKGPNGVPPVIVLFLLPFVAAGIGMLYAGLRAKYAVHLLFLGPEFIRLQRQLFGRKATYDVPTDKVRGVELKEFYRQNRRPVYGIEINAGAQKIRFGSALTTDEKTWLCAEVRKFVKTRHDQDW